MATISHLCKMTVATSQGQLLSEDSVYCSVTIKNQTVYGKNNSISHTPRASRPIAYIVNSIVTVNHEKLKPTITLYMLQYIIRY